MNEGRTFGECLAILLNSYKMNGSNLAKGINVDSSLIYKWLRNVRIPAYKSPYIGLITNYLIKIIYNSYQRENIVQALIKCGMDMSETDNDNILEKMKIMLLEAQGYSIETRINSTIPQKKPKKRHNIDENLLEPIDNHGYIRIREKLQPAKQTYPFLTDTNAFLSKGLYCGSDHIRIISGHNEVLYSALDLLKYTSRIKPSPDNNTILITQNSDMDLLPDYEEFNNQWRHALYCLLRNGWKIIFLVKLNGNVKRTLSIFEDIPLSFSNRNFLVYYYKRNANISAGNELFIIPNVAALFCFSSYLRNQVDSAFLFHSKKSIEALSSHFFQCFTSAKPLFQSYPSQKSTEFLQAITEAEENLGDRYVFKGGFSTITIPINLYEKYLSLSQKTEQEKSQCIYMHKRRIRAFRGQIAHYKYKDILFLESIERLVYEKQYSFNEYYLLENSAPTEQDIIYHLENVIYMLNKYDNYEVAVVNRKKYENFSQICCMVKENCSVFIETYNKRIYQALSLDSYDSEINLFVKEKEAINAFHDYFLMIWNDIPDESKNKGNIIEWLGSLIENLNAQQ